MHKGISGGELVARQFKRENVDTIFTLIGNQVSPMLVYMAKYAIKVIHTRHEKGAVHMADGWAQATRRAGVAMVSGGPGFTNAITGIVKAYYAKTPLLLITGAIVPQTKDTGVLSDMEQIAMIKPYTKWACTVNDAARIPEYIARGLQMANTGRKGPVVLEIPISILKQTVAENLPVINYALSLTDVSLAPAEKVDEFIQAVSQAKKPLIIAGDEVYYDYAEKELIEFVNLTQIPVYTVNKARGCIPDLHPLCMGSGRILEAGPQFYAYQNTDLVITIGLENDYQMGSLKPPYFREDQKFISINKEAYEIVNGNFRPELSLIGSVNKVLGQLCTRLKEIPLKNNYVGWITDLRVNQNNYWEKLHTESGCNSTSPIHPLKCIEIIKKLIKEDAIIVLDGSNAMFWGALCFECNYPGQLIIGPDGVLGPMGTGVSLAIGAKAANPDREVVLYTGDGSFGFNAIEMDSAVRFNLPILVFIHNDEAWGFCKTTQEILYEKTEAADLGMVRYDKMVEGLGGFGEIVIEINSLEESIIKAQKSNLPACVNIIVDKKADSPGAKSFNDTLKLQK